MEIAQKNCDEKNACEFRVSKFSIGSLEMAERRTFNPVSLVDVEG